MDGGRLRHRSPQPTSNGRRISLSSTSNGRRPSGSHGSSPCQTQARRTSPTSAQSSSGLTGTSPAGPTPGRSGSATPH
eukprot:1540025-Heterocapsa_arctica.AAC.1